MLSVMLLLGSPPALAQGANRDQATYDSAVFLLRQSVRVQRDNSHTRLLSALRQLADPTLAPLFNHLIATEEPRLQIHGMLGLAESSPERKLDLVRLAQIDDQTVQRLAVSAAMTFDLLGADQARQIINWQDMSDDVKLVVAARLVDEGGFDKIDILHEAAKSDRLAKQALANLLLLQLGHADAMAPLERIITSTAPDRDEAIVMLLQTAVSFEFDRIAPWALRLARDERAEPDLALSALSVAMRFRERGAAELWRQQLQSTTDVARRARLALAALRISPWVDAGIFDALVNDADPYIAQLGKAGRAIAQGKDVAEPVITLINMGQPVTNQWMLRYAKLYAEDEDAKEILRALILAYDDGHPRLREQRLYAAVEATQVLFDRSPPAAEVVIRPILEDPKADHALVEGILLGLVRTNAPEPQRVIAGLKPFKTADARRLALLLRARHGEPLDDVQIDDLARMVRGGGVARQSLRVQAAWVWLKLAGQTKNALADALGD